MNVNDGLIASRSPISSIPVEMLLHILKKVPTSNPRTIFKLCSVCSRWRNVCIDTPSFWSRIEIGCCKICDYMFATIFLQRCRKEPIDLVSSQASHTHSQLRASDYVLDDSFAAILNRYLGQVRSLRTYEGLHSTEPFVAFLMNSVCPFPSLRSVHISNIHAGTALWNLQVTKDSQRIHTLHLTSMYIPLKLPIFRDMVHLSVELAGTGPYASIDAMISILDSSPRMQLLKLRWVGPVAIVPPDVPLPPPSKIVRLPCLTRLHLMETTRNVAFFISHLDLPSKTIVNIEAWGGRFTDLFTLNSILKYRLTSVQTLRFEIDRFLDNIAIEFPATTIFFGSSVILESRSIYNTLSALLDLIVAPSQLLDLTLSLSSCRLSDDQWPEIIFHPSLTDLKRLSISFTSVGDPDVSTVLFSILIPDLESPPVGLLSLEYLALSCMPAKAEGRRALEEYLKFMFHAGRGLKEFQVICRHQYDNAVAWNEMIMQYVDSFIWKYE